MRRSHTKLKYSLIIFLIITILFLPTVSASPGSSTPVSDVEVIKKFIGNSTAAVLSHVRTLSSYGSRVVGTQGFYEARDYIASIMSNLADEIYYQNFTVAVPRYDIDFSYSVDGNNYRAKIYAILPNGFSLGQIGDIEGELVYVGSGELDSYRNMNVNDKIVLIDFESEINWLRYGSILGPPKAYIFIEPYVRGATFNDSLGTEFTRKDVYGQYVSIPINTPRFYARISDIKHILSLLENGKTIKGKIRVRAEWRLVKACNIIGYIKGTVFPDEVLIVAAHYDSYSIVPEISPGADEALGISFMLELMKFFSINRPKRSILFVALSGHWEGLAGARIFTKNIILGKTYNVKLFIYLAFSASGSELAILHAGRFYFNPTAGIEYHRAGVLDKLNLYIGQLKIKLYGGERSVESFIYPGYAWLNIIYGDPLSIFDSEAFTLAGGYGLAFYVPGPRLYWGTPYDEYSKFKENFENNVVSRKSNFLEASASLIYILANDLELNIKEPSFRLFDTNYGGFSTIRGRVLIYNLSTGWYTPVPNAIVRLRVIASMPNSFGLGIYGGYPKIKAEYVEGYYTTSGSIINITDSKGEFTIYGISPSALLGTEYLPSIRYSYIIEACILNERGEIEYYSDLGVHSRDVVFEINREEEMVNHVIFRCGSIIAYSIIEPETLSIPKIFRLEVRDALSHMTPQFYGSTFYSFSEGYSAFIVFSRPDTPIEIFIVSRSPLTGEPKPLVFLNNVSRGLRAEYGRSTYLKFSFIQIAEDLYNICSERYSMFYSQGIRNLEVEDNLNSIRLYLDKAREKVALNEYTQSMILALEAWKLAREVYVKLYYEGLNIRFSIIFVFILLIPFIYFFERLLFMYPDIKRQTLAMVSISIVIVVFLYLMHPAFKLVEDLFLLFLGVLISVLTLPTMAILLFDFASLLYVFKKKVRGPHFTGISRSGAIVAAFNIGASMMRRRKLRSSLTFATLVIIILALIIFSFPAVTIGVVKRNTYLAPTYTGILIRDSLWRNIPTKVINLVNLTLKESGYPYSISTRVWLYPSDSIYIAGRNEEFKGLISAFLGFDWREDKVSGISGLIVRGRWFKENDYQVCIVDEKAVEYLGINLTNVALGREYLTFSNGLKLKVVGVINGKLFSNKLELDGGNFTLLDIKGIAVGLKEERMKLFRYLPTSIVRGEDLGYFIVIVPSKLALDLGGKVYSIAVKVHEANIYRTLEAIDDIAKNLALRLNKTYFIYAVQLTPKKTLSVYRYMVSPVYVSGSVEQLVIPIAIGILILFNSMLSNVYERAKEIGVYSALGLSPYHVSGMFLAEAVILAVVSSMIGYLMGVFLAKMINVFKLFPKIYLNFTISIPIYSTMLSIAASLLAIWYPVLRASKMVTPSFEREWKPKSKPRGDAWIVNLPFVATSMSEAKAILKFILEYLEHYRVHGKIFTTLEAGIRYEEETPVLKAKLQMAPYELGIQQDVSIVISRIAEERYSFTLEMRRIRGPRQSWIRSSTILARELRKQFLIWRGLSLEEKRKYE